jgi:hypothetical protein
VLIEMLTGRRVMQGDDPRAVARQHMTMQIPTLSDIRPLIHVPTLERLLREATSPHPDMRPADAAALGAALDEIRRELSGDTRRLARPPVQAPSLRQRINQSASQILARPAPAQPLTPDPAPDRPVDRAARRAAANPRRPFVGIVVMLVMLGVFGFGAYYGISLVAEKLANIELPRPSLDLPALPDLGIEWPGWLTGIVSGGGQVWVVNIDGPEGLNMRTGPGIQQPIITFLPSGTHVRQIGGPQSADGVEWIQVRAQIDEQEVEGWVSALYLRQA